MDLKDSLCFLLWLQHLVPELTFNWLSDNKLDERHLVLTQIFLPANRNTVSCCCGTRTTGFPECSSGRWRCSIFLALSSLLQPEKIIDLKVLFETQHNSIWDWIFKNWMQGKNKGFSHCICTYTADAFRLLILTMVFHNLLPESI